MGGLRGGRVALLWEHFLEGVQIELAPFHRQAAVALAALIPGSSSTSFPQAAQPGHASDWVIGCSDHTVPLWPRLVRNSQPLRLSAMRAASRRAHDGTAWCDACPRSRAAGAASPPSFEPMPFVAPSPVGAGSLPSLAEPSLSHREVLRSGGNSRMTGQPLSEVSWISSTIKMPSGHFLDCSSNDWSASTRKIPTPC